MSTNEPTITVTEQTTLDEIIKQLDELGLIQPVEPPNYEFRLYYNEDGAIVAAAASAKDAEGYGLTGNYLVVSREEYENQNKYQVRNGKLLEIRNEASTVNQLEKSNTGFKVAKNNAGILIEPGEEHNNTEHYDYRNR